MMIMALRLGRPEIDGVEVVLQIRDLASTVYG